MQARGKVLRNALPVYSVKRAYKDVLPPHQLSHAKLDFTTKMLAFRAVIKGLASVYSLIIRREI